MGSQAEVTPSRHDLIRSDCHEESQLQHQIDTKADSETKSHRQGYIPLRALGLARQIHGRSKTHQTE